MYAALWRLLPGSTWVRVASLLAAFAVLVVVLFGYAFPVVEPLLPFDTITLEGQ